MALSVAWGVTSQEIRDHFATLSGWSQNDGYVFNAQYAQETVNRVAVAWMASGSAQREAVNRGCNLLICFSHVFPGDPYAGLSPAERAQMEQAHLVVLRCNGPWMRFPQYGYRDSLRDFLGLSGSPLNGNQSSIAVYNIPATAAGTFAQHVADRFADLGLGGVELIGNPNRTVTKFAIGEGGEQDARAMWLAGAQAGLVTEYQRWREIWWAIDNDVPLILVDRGIAETPGVLGMKAYVETRWPTLPCTFINNGPSYRWEDGLDHQVFFETR